MNRPEHIIVHCSATRENQDVTVEQIDAMHRVRGFKRPVQSETLKHIGYHYYIRKDGTVCNGRRENEQGAHCLNYNARSIGICYEGGLDAAGKPKDTRTEAQKETMTSLIGAVVSRYGIRDILGHRDTSPDLNGNGIIEPSEWIKSCPCFDAAKEWRIENGELRIF